MSLYMPKIAMRSAVLPLIVVTVAVFVLQVVLGDWFTNLFILKRGDLFARPWTLVTSMFLHGSSSHLLFNMYGLYLFGSLLEQRIGPRRLLLVYFISGIVAALVGSFIYVAALGASAALFGVIGVMIMLVPHLRLLFFFFIPMSLRTAGFIWVAIDVFGLFFPSGVANAAHLIGLGVGLLFGMQYKQQKRTYQRSFSNKLYLDEQDIEEYMRSGRL